jgi:hypothetical protein
MGLLTSVAVHTDPGGAERTPLIITAYSGGSVAAYPSANQGIFCKFRVGKGRTVTGIRVLNGTPSGNAKVALYSTDGTTLTQLALSASTALTGSNVHQDILFTAAVGIAAGQTYAAFLVSDNATATFYRISYASANFPGAALDLTYAVANAFTTPPTPQLESGLSTPAGGYTPVLALV